MCYSILITRYPKKKDSSLQEFGTSGKPRYQVLHSIMWQQTKNHTTGTTSVTSGNSQNVKKSLII